VLSSFFFSPRAIPLATALLTQGPRVGWCSPPEAFVVFFFFPSLPFFFSSSHTMGLAQKIEMLSAATWLGFFFPLSARIFPLLIKPFPLGRDSREDGSLCSSITPPPPLLFFFFFFFFFLFSPPSANHEWRLGMVSFGVADVSFTPFFPPLFFFSLFYIVWCRP